VQAYASKCAFLSTPSIYFSLKNKDIKENSKNFDIDESLKDKNWIYYDYRHPEEIPQELHNTFDFILIDPPFITEEVWTLYSKAIDMLKNENCKILLSTIDENKDMIKWLTNCDIRPYWPSIPNLVYQYSLYSNYEDEALNSLNPEIVMD